VSLSGTRYPTGHLFPSCLTTLAPNPPIASTPSVRLPPEYGVPRLSVGNRPAPSPQFLLSSFPSPRTHFSIRNIPKNKTTKKKKPKTTTKKQTTTPPNKPLRVWRGISYSSRLRPPVSLLLSEPGSFYNGPMGADLLVRPEHTTIIARRRRPSETLDWFLRSDSTRRPPGPTTYAPFRCT